MTELEAMKLLKDKQQAARMASAKLDRRRWEGCKYCETGSKDFDRREICVNVGNYINCEYFDCIGCHYFQSSEYCRRCGRPLTEEAEAAMKKREAADNEVD